MARTLVSVGVVSTACLIAVAAASMKAAHALPVAPSETTGRPVAGVVPGDGSGGAPKSTLKTGPIFNSPVSGTAKRAAIATQVGRLIAGAPAGSEISVAMYHFSSMDTAAQLMAASKRKVKVRVVLDHESAAYPATGRLRKALGGDTKKPSWAVVCGSGRGCIGPQFNHNKFFLFSATLSSANVVVQTSANATDGARFAQWNDALTVEDPQVYDAYRDYFDDLAGQNRTDDYHQTVQAGKYRLDFFPWSTGDPISDALDQVSCPAGTRLRLSIGHFTWGPIARRLWKLDDKGCRVQLVFDHIGKTALHDLTKPGGHHGNPEMRYLPEGGHPYAHSKYLLIDGGYQGRPQKVVFTGSDNYTKVGFHGHDEAMITVADAALETQYVTNFDSVFNRSHVVRPTDAGSVPGSVIDTGPPKPGSGSGE